METKDYEKIEISKNEERLVEQVDILKKQIQKMEKKINSLIAKKTIKKEKQESNEKDKKIVAPIYDFSNELVEEKIDNNSVNDEVILNASKTEEFVEPTIIEVSNNELSQNEDVTVEPSLDDKKEIDETVDEVTIDEILTSKITDEAQAKDEVQPEEEQIAEETPVIGEENINEPIEEEITEEVQTVEDPQIENNVVVEETQTDEVQETIEDPQAEEASLIEPVIEEQTEDEVQIDEEITESGYEDEETDNDDIFGSSFVMPNLSDEEDNNDNYEANKEEIIDEVQNDDNKDEVLESFGFKDFEEDLNNNDVVEEESFLNVPSNDFDEFVSPSNENKKEDINKVVSEPIKEEKIKEPSYNFLMPEFEIPTEEIKLDDEKSAKKAEEYEKTLALWSSVESSVSVIEVPKTEEKDELDYFTSQKVERQNKVEYVVNEAPKPIDVPTFNDIDFDGVDFDAPVFNKPKTELDLIANMSAEELKIYKKRRKEEQKANKQRLIKEQKEIQKTRKQDAKFSGRDKRNPIAKFFTTIFVIIFIIVLFIVVYGSFGVCDLLPTETYFGFINLYDFYEWLIVDTINPVCNKIGFDIITDFFEKIRDLLGK